MMGHLHIVLASALLSLISVGGVQVQATLFNQSTPLASGANRVQGLDFVVSVPEKFGRFPVVILLHGSGSSGERMLKEALKTKIEIAPTFRLSHIAIQTEHPYSNLRKIIDTHIMVAPSGHMGRWNCVAEPTTRDDVTLIGTILPEYLAKYPNVQPIFTLVGHSNGAGLVNRILIENDNPQITSAITFSSQLNQPQWHSGLFYIGGSLNKYKTPKRKLFKRRILQLTGGSDTKVPAKGGASAVRGKEGWLNFIPWQKSAYHFAQAYGYAGEPLEFTQDDDALSHVSYLNGTVQAYNLKGLHHFMFPLFVVAPFLLDNTTKPIM